MHDSHSSPCLCTALSPLACTLYASFPTSTASAFSRFPPINFRLNSVQTQHSLAVWLSVSYCCCKVLFDSLKYPCITTFIVRAYYVGGKRQTLPPLGARETNPPPPNRPCTDFLARNLVFSRRKLALTLGLL